MEVKLVSLDLVEENSYNPNHMAKPELTLLEHSIREDGLTQPIVCYLDKQKNKFVIVDGFHRYKLLKEKFFAKEIPVVVIDKPYEQRMASTIRHNRARGNHSIDEISSVVHYLATEGWTEQKISEELGMEIEEVIRFKQSLGIKSAFVDHEFSKSWITFEEKNYKNNQIS
ncbi:ParB N-terminal domain-containing protein [Enterococcus faecalis]|nr:ParB N-terminal domain-containing protein [Enterococcus faecalis]